jgi:hypothetical protein
MRVVLKVQKDTDDLTVFFAHLRYKNVKAAHKMLMKSTPGPDFLKNIARLF